MCKAVHERGCQKSGAEGPFEVFSRTQYNISKLPLEQFIGNRFNILFRNMAGVYFLYNVLTDFFDQNKEGNKLLKAVHSDLSVHHFIVGCRALGLVSKAITEPLWKAIEKPGHIWR